MSHSDISSAVPERGTPLPEIPALRNARIGHRAYSLMSTEQASTAPELCAVLDVSESELYAGIHAYLYVTTGYDLSPTSAERIAAVA